MQPNTSVLKIDAEILEPGEYFVCLELVFPSLGPEYWGVDCLALHVVLPELITHIHGGERLDVRHGDVIVLDASISQDPMKNLTSILEIPLHAYWSFATVDPVHIVLTGYNRYLAKLQGIPLLDAYDIQSGSDYALRVDTSMFAVGETACAMFTLLRGERKSSAYQCLKFVTNALPLQISYVDIKHSNLPKIY